MATRRQALSGLLSSTAILLLLTGCTSGAGGSPAALASKTATATATTSPAASASPTLSPSGNYASAVEAGIAGAEAKTGLTYSQAAAPCPSGQACPPAPPGPGPAGPCPAGESCLGSPQVFGNPNVSLGLDAAYVQIGITGSGGGAVCDVYVFYDSAAWHYLPPVVCPQQAGYNPVLGTPDHVHVPGDCANVRQGPGLSYKVVGCIKDGTLVTISTFFPRYADGHMWWGINGQQGWMAHDFLITP